MRKVILGLMVVGIVLAIVAGVSRLMLSAAPVPTATPTLAAGCSVVGPGESLSLQQLEAIEKAETQFEAAAGFGIPTITPAKALPETGCGVNVP